MNTINEIKAAIESLPKHQMEELIRWLSERLAHGQTINRDINLASLAGTRQEDPAFGAAILAFD